MLRVPDGHSHSAGPHVPPATTTMAGARGPHAQTTQMAPYSHLSCGFLSHLSFVHAVARISLLTHRTPDHTPMILLNSGLSRPSSARPLEPIVMQLVLHKPVDSTLLPSHAFYPRQACLFRNVQMYMSISEFVSSSWARLPSAHTKSYVGPSLQPEPTTASLFGKILSETSLHSDVSLLVLLYIISARHN